NLSAPTSGITDTFFDYCLLCRQRYTEDTIREAYERLGSNNVVHYGTSVIDCSVAQGTTSQFPVTTRLSQDGREITVRSKYIIGADGDSSTIRSLARVPFPGERSSRYWVRIDGRVRTDMPDARSGNCGLDSPTHGSILFACLDHGSTRIGFALPPHIWDEHGGSITEEIVISQAKEALLSFSLSFDRVSWYTVYGVGQRLAVSYRAKERIFLARDAAHTHSSGAAQGMNTGLHDAVNLAWKLAGEIKGYFNPAVLESYESDRRPVARMIVEQDRFISKLTGGEIPAELENDEGKDAATLLTEVFKKNVKLNTGLGVEYPVDGIVNVAHPSDLKIAVQASSRAPDVMVQRPGPKVPVRLHSLIKNDAVRFHILVFCGDPKRTASKIKALRDYLDGPAAEESLGCPGFGSILYDTDGTAHERYGIERSAGAVLILRPDGMVATAVHLGDGEGLENYFEGIVSGGLRDTSNYEYTSGDKV
ncbi:MAG: hypothetical protein Q9210_007335, partial [Variospora velana]